MVASGLVIGLVTGGIPGFSKEVSQLSLVVAMTFSLTEISYGGIAIRAEFRGFLKSLASSYGLLSGLLLLFAYLSPDPAIHDGWILMAAVPPAVAVVPITSYLTGDTRRALISLAVLYLLGLFLVPGITIAFTQQSPPIAELVLQSSLLVGVPIAASRPMRRWLAVANFRTSAVSVSFFVLVFAIAGSTREPLLARPDLLAPLILFAGFRTFGLGTAVFLAARSLHWSRDDRLAVTTFSSFKNLGLTVVLAFAMFGAVASLPSIVSLVFEILWLSALPVLFRRRTVSSSPQA